MNHTSDRLRILTYLQKFLKYKIAHGAYDTKENHLLIIVYFLYFKILTFYNLNLLFRIIYMSFIRSLIFW